MTIELPALPSDIRSFLSVLETSARTQADVVKLTKPYIDYESKLRQVYAQDPTHSAVEANHLVPVFGSPDRLTVRARDLSKETEAEKANFILALSDAKRRENGSPATVGSLKEFQTNFNLFCETSLVDLDWNNVVVSGSAVLTALLPVDSPHNESKRALRSYYHEQLAPASDVDIFIYGLDEQQAVEKIKKIEVNIRDAILSETTTIRTKNTITIVSEYPTRHVQVVLRLYKSISEVLTGFDVDCACVAYDGHDVWASPRALAALATQTNSIDLTRRSPSYENRLSKYAHRGFEVYWPGLDRSRIDPTIYERSFARVMGLARLLVLEKLPFPMDRDQYMAQRRTERGRPDLPWNARYRHALSGNIKESQPDDVPEWYDEDEVSSYHTFTIPYGPKYTASKIEKLLFKKDLLLNAEWNKPKDRKTILHRHPAFFGKVEDVIMDCCGSCPKSTTDDDLAALEEESKLFVSGELAFMKDDPGRQAIGSFHPLTQDDWTDMAYVGSTSLLCQAIVNNDLEGVKDWFTQGGDVNRRDHTGRTPLHLACMSGSLDIVQYLIDHDARLVARLYNGLTALHMAAHRGDVEIVKALLDRSFANEAEEEQKEETRKSARRTANQQQQLQTSKQDQASQESKSDSDSEDPEEIDAEEYSDQEDNMTDGSFVKVQAEEDSAVHVEDTDEPDFFDIDVLAWDAPVSPLHLAIMAGHTKVIELLTSEYAADVLLPVKLMTDNLPRQPRAAILSMILPLELSLERSSAVVQTLIAQGASPAQADMRGVTALHYIVSKAKNTVVELLRQISPENVNEIVLNHLCLGDHWNTSAENPLLAAIRTGSVKTVRTLLSMGAKPEIEYEVFAKAQHNQKNSVNDPEQIKKQFHSVIDQPVVEAAQRHDMADIVELLIDAGVDVNSMNKEAKSRFVDGSRVGHRTPMTLLDLIHERIEALQDFTTVKKRDYEPVRPNSMVPAGLGEYGTWLARGNLATANVVYDLQAKHYQSQNVDQTLNDKPGMQAKVTAIQNMRVKYQDISRILLAKGAKTFIQLCPDSEAENMHQNIYGHHHMNNDSAKPWTNKLSFMVPDLTDAKKELYDELFEAAYQGDEETITLLCVKGRDGKLPLQIAVQDLAGFSPFSLAIMRGHPALADTIIDIAAAQYTPTDTTGETYRYTLRHDDDASDSDSYMSDSDDEDSPARQLRFAKELADTNFTIEDILTRAKEVKSKVSPADMVSWTCEVWRASRSGLDSEESKAIYAPSARNTDFPSWMPQTSSWSWFNFVMDNESNRCRKSLLSYAIAGNDFGLLQYLLRTMKRLRYSAELEHTLQQIQLSPDETELALRMGRTEMVSYMIEHTGMLLPLETLVKSSGIQIERKPRFYQGLSVRGKKRADWAAFGQSQSLESSMHSIPMLLSAFSGNLTSMEFFLSDTPLRRYENFADAFSHDKRVESLVAAKGGLGKALSAWMNTRAHLTLHMAVMAPQSTSIEMLKYLLRRLPQYLDSKSKDGITPLQLAFRIKNYEAAKVLIAAGADQLTRNALGENVMHTIYNHRADAADMRILEDCVALLSTDNVKRLLVQRCKTLVPGSQTPLALFCDKQDIGDSCDILDIMIEYSDGMDLRIMDGAGDYILHKLVRQDKTKMAVHLAKKVPELLFVESATGMTPLEVAETAWLKEYIRHNPPQVPRRMQHYGTPGKDIIERPASNFIHDPLLGNPAPELPLRDSLREIANKNPHPRKLVSLLDANEIARRLAERQTKNSQESRHRDALGMRPRRYENTMDTRAYQSETDEVNQWWAQAAKNRDL